MVTDFQFLLLHRHFESFVDFENKLDQIRAQVPSFQVNKNDDKEGDKTANQDVEGTTINIPASGGRKQ